MSQEFKLPTTILDNYSIDTTYVSSSSVTPPKEYYLKRAQQIYEFATIKQLYDLCSKIGSLLPDKGKYICDYVNVLLVYKKYDHDERIKIHDIIRMFNNNFGKEYYNPAMHIKRIFPEVYTNLASQIEFWQLIKYIREKVDTISCT